MAINSSTGMQAVKPLVTKGADVVKREAAKVPEFVGTGACISATMAKALGATVLGGILYAASRESANNPVGGESLKDAKGWGNVEKDTYTTSRGVFTSYKKLGDKDTWETYDHNGRLYSRGFKEEDKKYSVRYYPSGALRFKSCFGGKEPSFYASWYESGALKSLIGPQTGIGAEREDYYESGAVKSRKFMPALLGRNITEQEYYENGTVRSRTLKNGCVLASEIPGEPAPEVDTAADKKLLEETEIGDYPCYSPGVPYARCSAIRRCYSDGSVETVNKSTGKLLFKSFSEGDVIHEVYYENGALGARLFADKDGYSHGYVQEYYEDGACKCLTRCKSVEVPELESDLLEEEYYKDGTVKSRTTYTGWREHYNKNGEFVYMESLEKKLNSFNIN